MSELTERQREEIEAEFSAAYDGQLDPEAKRAFDAALAEDPELTARYAAFCGMLGTLKGLSADDAPAPDLLRGVQRRLRDKSGGRYYSDRFAERSGWGATRLTGSLLVFAIFLALVWASWAVFSGVQLAP